MKKLIFMFLLFNLFCSQKLFATEVFSWPSDGYRGDYIYKSQTTYCSGNCHTGIDIWSTVSGGWINNQTNNSNPIYSVYAGNLYYEDVDGYYIKHNNSLYSIYYHVRDRQLTSGQSVNSNTLVGYQDVSGGVVHLHLTVSTAASDSSHIDPSPYFGMQLNSLNANPIPVKSLIQRSNLCGSANVTLQGRTVSNAETFNCAATNNITILPDTNFNNGSNVHLYIQ